MRNVIITVIILLHSCLLNGNANKTKYKVSLSDYKTSLSSLFALTTQASNITFSSITPASALISWTKGNGAKRLVFVKQTNSASEIPTLIDNTTYIANANFGMGTQIGTTGWFCVNNANSTSVTVNNLNTSLPYRVVVFEYDGNAGFEKYNQVFTFVQGNPVNTPPSTQATNLTVNNLQNLQTDISWTRGNGDSCIVFMIKSTSTTALPSITHNTSYSANTVFGTGTAWYCIYKGTGSSTTVTGLSSKTGYRILVLEYSGNHKYQQYNTSSISNNVLNITTKAKQSTNIVFSNVLPTSMTVNWTIGDGNARAVFVKETSNLEIASPLNNTRYVANTIFSKGDQIDNSGWYCVYNGTDKTVNVYGLTPGKSYRVMVCEYTGSAGTENYSTFEATNNPLSCKTGVQASQIIYSNIQSTSINFSWFRGSEDSCAVFMRPANNSTATPVNGTIYKANSTFLMGDQIGNSGWFCIYKGKGSNVTVNVTSTNDPYQIMVCEFTNTSGFRVYNTSTAIGNPITTPVPVAPTSQACRLNFSNLLPTSVTISCRNGNGNSRAIFIKETSGTETALPEDNVNYNAETYFKLGSQIGSSGWFCIYNGSSNGLANDTITTVNVTGLLPGQTYRVMACDYNYTSGFERYNTSSNGTNPLTIQTFVQASNILFSNFQPTSLDVSWSRGTGDSCAVFIKELNYGNAAPENGTNYYIKSQIGSTGWYCVYKGKDSKTTITDINTNQIYRVMVIEYTNKGNSTYYNLSIASGNPTNTLTTVPNQATNVLFKNLTASYATISWDNGKGSSRVVFMKKTKNLESASPFNKTYLANSTFGKGTEIDETGWYCIYNGAGNSLNVYGLVPDSSYCVMVCEYNGPIGFEQYNISTNSTNPTLTKFFLQASNVTISDIQPNSMNLSWYRGNGDSCAVFIKQATSGTAIPTNGIIYNPNSNFSTGTQIGTSGWYCVYTGTGTNTVVNLNTNLAYQIMVCEYSNSSGTTYFNKSIAANNPVNKPAVPGIPTKPSQSKNIVFSALSPNSMTITWARGNGTNSAVFVKETTTLEYAAPVNNTSYSANARFGAGDGVGTSGWYCVYKGTASSTTVTGLINNKSYCVMVCDYNGSAGSEFYNTDPASGNSAIVTLTTQASAITFSNLQNNSMTISWMRGTGSACLVFVKEGAKGNVSLYNNLTYKADSNYGLGSPDGTGWFCVFNGTGNNTTVTGLKENTDYWVMVCEYNGTLGNELYNTSTSTNNPLNRPLTPKNQAYNINFTNLTASSATINWSNGNGNKRVVFIKETNVIESANPNDKITYEANPTFGTGEQIETSGWFCIYNGTVSSVSVNGLTSGKSYRVMVCEYSGTPGNELYNKDPNSNNPASLQLITQASNVIFSNVQETSADISWTSGNGAGSVVFIKQGSSGTVSLNNNLSYKENNIFGGGTPDGTGWFCIYNGTGNSASVTGLTPNKDYIVMVCSYNGASGAEEYNTSNSTGNPALKPLKPFTQASSLVFSSITNTTVTLSWSRGNGTNRAVFMKKTSGNEIANPDNNTTYAANTTFGSGTQIGTSEWFCVYNGTGTSVSVTGLTAGETYKLMICEYNGTPGVEQYNTDLAISNPASVTLSLQSTNVHFTDIQSTSMRLSWQRGSDNACVVFIGPTSGNVALTNGITYNANSVYGNGSPNGTGWYCVYNGTDTSVLVTGLLANTNYRVMVCEYNGSAGNESYNTAAATGNPANKTIAPTTQAINISFTNTLVGRTNVSWTRGNGGSCAVFIKQTSSTSETVAPINNTNYAANNIYGNGTQIGSSGWFCIYKGTGTTVNVTGLSGGTTYRVIVFEYNGVPNGEIFNLNVATNNPNNVTTISNKADQTITFTSIAPRQYGSADFDPGATSSSGLPVIYTSSNLSVATIVNGLVHIVGMGTTTITASHPGDADYTPATPVDLSLLIEMGTQGINFSPLTVKYFGDPDFDPGAVASSGLEVNYSSNNTSVAIIINNKIHIVGVGTTSISAYQPGNSNFYPASSVFQNLTVAKKTQAITFNPLPSKTFEDPDFDPGAVSNSNLQITYVSTNTNVATIIGNRVHIVAAGAVNILATQPGNTFYSPAPFIPQTLVINKANQAITFNSIPDLIYEDIYLDPAISSSGLDVEYYSDNNDVAEIINGRIHIVGAGNANIRATQLGNNNYNAAIDVNQSLTVSKTDQTITFNTLPSAIFGDPDLSLNATSTSGLPIEYSSDNTSVAKIVNGKIHITGAGTANITAFQSGDNRYNAASIKVNQPFTVNHANQTISFNSIPAKTFGDADFALSATANSGLPVSFSIDNPGVATVTDGMVHIVGSGVANITATQSGNGLYSRAAYVVHPLVVNKASQTLTFEALPSKAYGDPDIDLSATSSSGLPVTFTSSNTSVATIVNGKIHIVGAGTTNISAIQTGNANYNPADIFSRPFVVSKITQTILFNPLPPKAYTDADFSPGATSSTGLPITYSSSNTNVAIVVGDKIHIVGLGTTNITATQTGNTNYNAIGAVQTLTVNKASQTINFNAIPIKQYGSLDFNLSASASSGMELVYTSSNPAVATVTNGRVHIVGVGVTAIRATQPGDAYFNSTFKTQNLIVTKANQTITFSIVPELIYGIEEYMLEAESSSGLPVTFTSNNPTVATVNLGWLKIIGAGTVTITATQSGNSFYSAASSISQVVVIKKNSQIIYFDTIPEKTYGDSDFDPEAVSSSRLTVNYTSNNPSVATIVNGKIHIVGAGLANITAVLAANNNYTAANSITKLLVVKKATVLITADNSIRKFNTSNPEFKYNVSGLVNGENVSYFNVAPYIVTNATLASLPGIYELIPQGGSDNNYDFIYKKGYLTILGTSPVKPSKPYGPAVVCQGSDDQTFSTDGGPFATSYVWGLIPSNAGTISGTGKSAVANFNESYVGKASIFVKGKNMEVSESSDTFHITVLPKVTIPEVSYRGSYCNNNLFGDSILIYNSPALYKFQLYQNDNAWNNEIEGTGSKIGWYDIKSGTYSLIEKLCNVVINNNIIIEEVSPSSYKPQLHLKWNDVLVCVKNEDSIIHYSWYKDGVLIPGENKQYLWTQQKTGSYAVKTTDYNGCDFLSDEMIVELPSKGFVYPNPNHGQFEVSFSNSEKGDILIKIFSIKSLHVITLPYTKDDETFKKEVTLQGLSTGIYFIDVLLNGKRVFYEKIIID